MCLSRCSSLQHILKRSHVYFTNVLFCIESCTVVGHLSHGSWHLLTGMGSLGKWMWRGTRWKNLTFSPMICSSTCWDPRSQHVLWSLKRTRPSLKSTLKNRWMTCTAYMLLDIRHFYLSVLKETVHVIFQMWRLFVEGNILVAIYTVLPLTAFSMHPLKTDNLCFYMWFHFWKSLVHVC